MRVAACLLVFGLFVGSGVHQAPARTSVPLASLRARPAVVPAYRVPLPGPVRIVRPFVAPVTTYGPGHRGVDLAARSGETVLAAGSGTVTFAGLVARRGVVVILHPDGIRTEYEPVTPSVSIGTAVASGDAIGVVHGAHTGCDPGACLHWGARRGDVYFDPMTLLRPLGVVRLLPLAG